MREKKIHVWELPNGFTVYTRHDEISRLSGFGANVGSLYDPPGLRGMAHVYEHLIARESRDYTVDDYYHIALKYLGIDSGVQIQTDRTSTYFGHEGMIRTDHMLNVLPVLAGFVRDRIVNQKGLDIELPAVLQETYEMGLDDVQDCLSQAVLETLYERNPVRNRVDCEQDELRNFSVQNVRRYGRRYFTPANMFMIMLGPSHERAKRIAEKYFGDLPKGSKPRMDYDGSDNVPVLTGVRSVVRGFRGTRQIHTSVVWPTEVYGSQDDIALDVLANILALRLYVRLREENRVIGKGTYHPSVATDRTLVHGLFEASFSTSDQEFAKYGYDVILEEVRKLKQELVPVRTFDAAVTYPELCWLDAFRFNPDSLANMILEAVSNGDEHCKGLESFQDDLRKLTRKKLRDVANRYLKDEHVYAVVHPE